MNKLTAEIIAIFIGRGRQHDFRLFKESKTRINPETSIIADSGYQGLQKIHANTRLPKKKSKRKPLSKEDKKINRKISSQRVLNENVIGVVKRFRILAEKYRNRRKRFGLRFNLIAGIYNFEIHN